MCWIQVRLAGDTVWGTRRGFQTAVAHAKILRSLAGEQAQLTRNQNGHRCRDQDGQEHTVQTTTAQTCRQRLPPIKLPKIPRTSWRPKPLATLRAAVLVIVWTKPSY